MPDTDESNRIMSKHLLTVSEVFGPTLQGEGISQGKPASFIRTALCNLDCKWCDTPFTWDWTGKNGYAYSKALETRRLPTDTIADMVDKHCKRVVISGGEPMIQQTSLLQLVRTLRERGKEVEIETNGTQIPNPEWLALAVEYSDLGVQFNVSPKLWHSGVEWDTAINIDALTAYKHLGAVFKFVVKQPHCIHQIEYLANLAGLEADTIWLMPEGRTALEVTENLQWVFDECVRHNWNLTPRLHVLAYNDKRGI